MGRNSKQPGRHQDNSSLISMWFPRPAGEDAVVLLEPHGDWTAAKVFELFSNPDCEEWRHKVGVAGPVDGSAKSTTRLLAVRGWVLKTCIGEASASRKEVFELVSKGRAAGLAASVWHPLKIWVVMSVENQFYPLTICPELVTLRQLDDWNDRSLAWIEMIQSSIDVHHSHGLGLDLNPANFGRDGQASRLFYLDDEFYTGLSERNVANAIVARIPEEPTVVASAWRSWGEKLKATLSLGKFSWDGIAEEIRIYPLPERFEECRKALLSVLLHREKKSKSSRKKRVTCVIADVHGNLPALEAVLEDARSHDADSFLFLGDAIGYGPQPSECISRLAELPQSVLLRGNHDHAVATGQFEVGMNRLARHCAEWTRSSLGTHELEWLAELAPDYFADEWLAVHGAPQDPRRFLAYVYELTFEDNLRYLRQAKIPLCFCGHTHVQMTYAEVASGPTRVVGASTMQLLPKFQYLVNPGSVGQPRDGDPRAAYALWDRQTAEVKTLRVAYDLERTIAALHAAQLPSQLEGRLRAGA